MNFTWRRIFTYIFVPAAAGIAAMWMVIVNSGSAHDLALLDASVSVILFTLGATILGNILRYYRPSEGREWTLIAWIAAIDTAWLFGSISLIFLFIPATNEAYEDLVIGTLLLRFFVSAVVLTCLALITWIRRQNESEKKSLNRFNEIQKISREAELNTLRQQLQPHFLFNSLNSIQALTSSDPARAKKMLLQLSDFLRGTLRKDNHSYVTVEEEIEHTRLYLEIEMVRFSDRLQLQWNLDENCFDKKIPALVLQPLVENAIKFGVYQTTGPVLIGIDVSCLKELIKISVQNPYDPQTAIASRGTGFGLTSLQRRMYLLFGRNDLLQTYKEESTFTATLQIPFSP
jgi:two-component system LytT family sensor kinase